MDQKQLEALTRHEETVRTAIYLQAKDYTSNATRDPKTLLYGYTCDRETHHVFQDHYGHIYIYVYRNNLDKPETSIRKADVSGDGIESLDELVPNKRLYPQYCDFDFCVYLKERGVHLPFTKWEEPKPNPTNPRSIFAGEIF
jgi:hypothetical protein